jgi:hypothetical protein
MPGFRQKACAAKAATNCLTELFPTIVRCEMACYGVIRQARGSNAGLGIKRRAGDQTQGWASNGRLGDQMPDSGSNDRLGVKCQTRAQRQTRGQTTDSGSNARLGLNDRLGVKRQARSQARVSGPLRPRSAGPAVETQSLLVTEQHARPFVVRKYGHQPRVLAFNG